jgi:hypothetical protein
MAPIRREKIVKKKPSVYNYLQKKMSKEDGATTPTTPRILAVQNEENAESPGN